jgi:hypothetical protein
MSMEYKCNVCNKQYKTYQTLWKHNKQFHINNYNDVENGGSNMVDNVVVCGSNVVVSNNNLEDNNKKIYSCTFCNKIFNDRSNKHKHMKLCKEKCVPIINDITKLQEENKQKELEIILRKEEYKILQLKLKLQKSEKIDIITLKKLNKLLLQRHNLMKNCNNTTNIQNNQHITNNFQLIGFGKEDDIAEILTKQEKKMIMNAKFGSLEKLIEIVHCGKYSQFKNIIITNIKDNYMYKYDEKQGVFVLSTKGEVLNMLVDHRVSDLEVIYNDLLSKNKLDDATKNSIERFINKLHNVDLPFEDGEGKEHDNYREYKISEIKILLFNNQDRITEDISLMLTTT